MKENTEKQYRPMSAYMMRARAEAMGLKIGCAVRQISVSRSSEDGKMLQKKVVVGTVIEIWKHGFVVQLPHYKTFYRFNELRETRDGTWLEIV